MFAAGLAKLRGDHDAIEPSRLAGGGRVGDDEHAARAQEGREVGPSVIGQLSFELHQSGHARGPVQSR